MQSSSASDRRIAAENAKAIVKTGNRELQEQKTGAGTYPEHMKQKATVGYSFEAIVKQLDAVANSQVDELGTTKPLIECITSGVTPRSSCNGRLQQPEGKTGQRSYRADEEADRK